MNKIKEFYNKIKEMINDKPFLSGFFSGGIITVIIMFVLGLIM